MLWNGGCENHKGLGIIIAKRSSVEECRILCRETDDCGVFFVFNGSDDCHLYREEAVLTCNNATAVLVPGYWLATAFSVNECGIGLQT